MHSSRPKKIIAILLLAVFSFSSVGYIFLLEVVTGFTRNAAQRSISRRDFDHTKLVKLNFTRADHDKLEWEDETEFIFKGKRYDLVSRDILKDGSINFICLSDDEEDEFYKCYDENFDLFAIKDPKKNNPLDILKLLLKNYDLASAFSVTTIPGTPCVYKRVPVLFAGGFPHKFSPPPWS